MGALGKRFVEGPTIEVPWAQTQTGFWYGVQVPAGLVVVDVDDSEIWHRFIREYAIPGEQTRTFSVLTPRGFHLYFTHDRGKGFIRDAGFSEGFRPPEGKSGASFDLVCEGGIVAVPPSPGYCVHHARDVLPLPGPIAALIEDAQPASVAPSRFGWMR